MAVVHVEILKLVAPNGEVLHEREKVVIDLGKLIDLGESDTEEDES